MFQANEDSIVKSLEIIAKCQLRLTELAEGAMKKSQELFEANMAIMKENQIKPEIRFVLNEEQLKDLDDTGSQIRNDLAEHPERNQTKI